MCPKIQPGSMPAGLHPMLKIKPTDYLRLMTPNISVINNGSGAKLWIALIFAAAWLFPNVAPAAGPAAINLRSAAPFAILATSTTTTTGGGIINGDVGLSPVGSQGIPAGQIHGTIYNGGPIAAQAQLDLNSAIIAASPAQLPGGSNVGAELGGQTLVAGIYASPSGAFGITAVDLTLHGGPDDIWVFQMASTLTVGVGRRVVLTGGAQARNIFWQVGSSATLGTSCAFEGTVMAYASITMNASSTLDGRAMAQNGAVTFNGSGGTLPAPAAPIFTRISLTRTNTAILVLQSSPYFPLTLQTSLDLLNWTTVATNTPVINTCSFTNIAPVSATRRFYRAFITLYP